MRLLLSISLTLLRAKLKQSIVAAVGVSFSITMFVTLLGFMNGLNGMLDGLILNRTPHVRLYNELKATPLQPIERAYHEHGAAGSAETHHFIRSVKPKSELPRLPNALGVMRTLAKDPRVLAVTPRLVAQVFFNVGTVDLNAQVSGVDVEQEVRYYRFADYLTQGDAHDLATGNNTIVLGKGLADMMEADIGDVVQVTTATGDRALLRVTGMFQSGIADYDKVQCYASVKTVQKLLGRPSTYFTDINVKLHDLALAPAMAKELAMRFNVDAMDVQTANAQFETGSHIRSIISYAVGVTLLIVAGFGIYNILNMMIYEKLDAIAILKATGFSGGDVRRIFLLLSMIIGIAGGAAGLLCGIGLQHIIDNIPFVTAALPTITTFPIDYDPRYYIIAVTFALITTWIAGWFPARKASQVDPVQIIRGEMSTNANVLEVRKVNKSFHDPVTVPVLKDVSLEVKLGEFVSITGKSGCGKSTLLYILSTMDTDFEGEVVIDGEPTHAASHSRLAEIRNEKIGFVFQFHYLLPEFSVLRNVMLPGLKLARRSTEEVEQRAMQLLRDLDMHDHALKGANQLSGGQKQRVAIARALINDPLIIMGDEPTGNLDSRNSAIVFDIFRGIAGERKRSLLVVTHDEDFARRTDRTILMDDGRVMPPA